MNPYYQDDHCTIYHGDCRDILPELPKVDIVVTDPPYDTFTHKGGRFQADSGFGNVDFGPIENYDFIGEIFDVCEKWVIVFCPLESLGKIKGDYVNNYVRGIFWDRINPSPQLSGDRPSQAGEGIALLHTKRKNMKWNGRGKAGIYRCSVEFNQKQHPTQKPLKLIKNIISDFLIGEVVLDPFMGSGTTLRAAKDLNRKAIGIEISEKYCEIAVKRLQQEVMDL